MLAHPRLAPSVARGSGERDVDPNYAPYVPILACAILVVGMGAAILLLNRFLGPRRPTREKGIPYESGDEPHARPRQRFSVKFYMTAILFLVFDLEVVFIYPWAAKYNDFLADGAFGGVALGAMLFFLAVLTLGLVYEWKRGAMDWE
ncbi:MAG: NADH-quinone oxidoreductase subunit A [Deltaproteobacteria bacterium]|nr:NADH-quinone oxidoreductase subunit A [Deltaproteobacteria bacterium]